LGVCPTPIIVLSSPLLSKVLPQHPQRLTRRCSEHAPQSRPVRQTTTIFPPTGTARACSACR
jgi:hypothetical protein